MTSQLDHYHIYPHQDIRPPSQEFNNTHVEKSSFFASSVPTITTNSVYKYNPQPTSLSSSPEYSDCTHCAPLYSNLTTSLNQTQSNIVYGPSKQTLIPNNSNINCDNNTQHSIFALDSDTLEFFNQPPTKVSALNATDSTTSTHLYEVPCVQKQLRTPKSDSYSSRQPQDESLVSESPSLPSNPEQPPPPYYPPVDNLFSMSMPGSDSGGSPIITQVSQPTSTPWTGPQAPMDNLQTEIMNEKISVNARGTVIEMARRELSRLPQCILVGIANSLPPNVGNINNILMADVNDPPIPINFPPNFLKYTLEKFRETEKDQVSGHQHVEEPRYDALDMSEIQGQGSSYSPGPHNLAEAIRTNPAVIVLREDLDFYCLPPTVDISKKRMNEIKRAAGAQLVSKYNYVLTGLKKSSTPGSPESHLIEMLCSTGFKINEKWGYREMEPEKTVVSSLALVRLRTDSEEEEEEHHDETKHEEATGGNFQNFNSEKSLSPEATVGSNQDSQYTHYAEPLKASHSTTSTQSSDTFSTAASLHTVPESPPSEDHDPPKTPSVDTSKNETSIPNTSNTNTPTAETSPVYIESKTLPPSPEEEEVHFQPVDESSSSSSSSDEEDEHPSVQPQNQFPPPAVDLAKSQKLFLFWRKPARKCWWDIITLDHLELPAEDSSEIVDVGPIKVHVRSVWTLELCIVD